MGKRRILELSVAQVSMDVLGSPGKGRTEHALVASLVYPRPAVALRECIKTLVLEDGTADMRKAGWTTRILFKETVEGPFGMELGISGPIAAGQVGKFVSFLGASLLKFVGAEVSGDMQSPVGGGFVRVPFEHLSNEIKEAKKKTYPDLAGKGMLDLDPDSFAKKGLDKELKVPLVAPGDIHKVVTHRRYGRVEARRRILLKAGEPNGSITLHARLY